MLEKVRDLAAQVHHAAEQVHLRAEETRRLSVQARVRSRGTRALVRSNRREADETAGLTRAGFDGARRARRRLTGKAEDSGG
jgi:hypothetical protein